MAPPHKQAPLKVQHGMIVVERVRVGVGVTWPELMDSKTRYTCRFTFCAVAPGQRLRDSDATLKAFLSGRQVDALQSKRRDSG